jgi:hypothetical protein
MLRIPLIDHGDDSAASLTIVAYAALSILDTYATLRDTFLFTPSKWAETRRITTAAQIVFLSWRRGELGREQVQNASDIAESLLAKLHLSVPATQALVIWGNLMRTHGRSIASV